MSRHPRSPTVYRKGITRILTLSEVLRYPRPQPTRSGWTSMLRLPSCGAVLERVLNNGWQTRVEHHHDGHIYLVIANQLRYEIVGCPPRRLDPARRKPPPNLYLLDKTGHRVRSIFQTADGYVGSRHELAAGRNVWVYASYGLTAKQRQQRHIEKIKAKHPLRWSAILDGKNDLKTVMQYRPRKKTARGLCSGHRWRRTWIEECVRAKWGYVRKGDAEKLQSEIIAAVTEHLRKRLPWGKRIPGANFWRGLHPINQLRKQVAYLRHIKYIAPVIPLRSNNET
jgi:hypothetical protein